MTMKHAKHKQSVKDNDFLASVARSIGSTLGAVAATVSRPPRAPKKSKKAASRKQKKRKDISK